MVGLLLAVLTAAIVASLPAVRAERFEPLLPHGAGGVGSAVGVLIFAFVGWEAASHLSAEFEGRRLLTATGLTLATITVLYLSMAVTVVGSGAASSPVPLTAMMATGIGPAAEPVTGIAALVLTFGAINTYIAGASRLGVALAEQRLLPHRIAAPHRGLVVLGAAIAVLAAATLLLPIGLDPLLRATSACLAAVMLVGTLAAVRLLPAGRMRAVAVASSALTALTLLLSGVYLIVPAVIAVAGFSARGLSAADPGAGPCLRHGQARRQLGQGLRRAGGQWFAVAGQDRFDVHAGQLADRVVRLGLVGGVLRVGALEAALVRTASPATSTPVAGSKTEMWPSAWPGVSTTRIPKTSSPSAERLQRLGRDDRGEVAAPA